MVEKRLDELDDRVYAHPSFDMQRNEKVAGIGEWKWFGRLRCDMDIEALAGEAPEPPIMRPIELTSVNSIRCIASMTSAWRFRTL